MRNPLCLLAAACLSFALPLAAVAQTTSPALLPPAAQEALDKGIIAAKVPDYPLAIRFFEDARKLAPDAPVVYLNLGLAESRIPGRELRAIAWFGAYLAAAPDAPNAAAVRQQIAVLDVRNQSNVSRLIKTVQDVASQLSGNAKSSALYEVAYLWACIGDIPTALKTVDLIDADSVFRKIARDNIATVQEKGPISEEKRLLTQEPDTATWLGMLDDTQQYYPSTDALGTEQFIDLNGRLNSLQSERNPQEVYNALFSTARKIAKAQNIVHELLARQTEK